MQSNQAANSARATEIAALLYMMCLIFQQKICYQNRLCTLCTYQAVHQAAPTADRTGPMDINPVPRKSSRSRGYRLACASSIQSAHQKKKHESHRIGIFYQKRSHFNSVTRTTTSTQAPHVKYLLPLTLCIRSSKFKLGKNDHTV